MKTSAILIVGIFALIFCMTLVSNFHSGAFAAEGLKVSCDDCDQSGDCDLCDGKGGRVCHECKGDTVTKDGSDCTSCAGAGMHYCKKCSGTGNCLSCEGQGYILKDSDDS